MCGAANAACSGVTPFCGKTGEVTTEATSADGASATCYVCEDVLQLYSYTDYESFNS